jgi:hypothetical protein
LSGVDLTRETTQVHDIAKMPPPSNQRADIEPPEELTTEAVKGFMTGVFRVCSPGKM